MEYSDEIKAEIKRVAQVQGISVRKAAKDPYIQFKISEVNADNRTTEAGITRTPSSRPAAPALDTSKPQFNMATEEGRKAYQEHKKKRHGKA